MRNVIGFTLSLIGWLCIIALSVLAALFDCIDQYWYGYLAGIGAMTCAFTLLYNWSKIDDGKNND